MVKFFTMLITALVVLVVVTGGIWLVAKNQPDTYQVQRSIEIRATPSAVFALIDDFHRWRTWAPQDIEDVTMTRTFTGPAAGLGAVSSWTSRGNAGRGRMEITTSTDPTLIVVTVDFEQPFRAHNLNTFALQEHGGSTAVTWTMQGTNPMMLRVISIFLNLDKLMGKHFESGLARLKQAAESGG